MMYMQILCPYTQNWPLGRKQKVKTFFSESGHIVSQIKEKEA